MIKLHHDLSKVYKLYVKALKKKDLYLPTAVFDMSIDKHG